MMKKTLILATTLILSSCGFTPMHAPQLGSDGAAFKNIQIEVVEPERLAHQEGAFWVEQALYDRLGKDGRLHLLKVEPKFTRSGIGISAEDVATRYDLRVNVKYRLIDKKTGDVLDKGSVSTSSSFGAPRDPYGRSISEQTATKNVSKEVTDRLIIRLAAYYANAGKK